MQHRTYLAALPLALLMACDGDPRIVEPDVTKIKLSGLVESDGEAIAGARVLLDAEPTYRRFDDTRGQAVTVSGAGGYFGFEQVHKDTAAEYDIAIRDDLLGSPLVTQFLRIHHQRQLFFSIPGDRPRKGWSGRVFVNLENKPANASVLYVASGHVLGLDDGDGLTLHWNGTYQDSVTLRAIAYEKDPATQLPLRYLAYAENAVRVTHGTNSQWVGAFGPIGTAETEFQLSPAENAESPAIEGTVFVDAGDDSNAREIGHLSSGTGKVTLPTFNGVRYTLRAEQRAATGIGRIFRRFSPTNPVIAATFPTSPVLVDAPAAHAAIEKDTTFRWKIDSGIVRVRLDGGAAFRIETYTQASEFTLSNAVLGLLGLNIGPNTPVAFTVMRIPRFATVDDAIGGPQLRPENDDNSDSPPLPLVFR